MGQGRKARKKPPRGPSWGDDSDMMFDISDIYPELGGEVTLLPDSPQAPDYEHGDVDITFQEPDPFEVEIGDAEIPPQVEIGEAELMPQFDVELGDAEILPEDSVDIGEAQILDPWSVDIGDAQFRPVSEDEDDFLARHGVRRDVIMPKRKKPGRM